LDNAVELVNAWRTWVVIENELCNYNNLIILPVFRSFLFFCSLALLISSGTPFTTCVWGRAVWIYPWVVEFHF
jgi:ABC-type uncharacterized transport system YnjBCD permease subunit